MDQALRQIRNRCISQLRDCKNMNMTSDIGILQTTIESILSIATDTLRIYDKNADDEDTRQTYMRLK